MDTIHAGRRVNCIPIVRGNKWAEYPTIRAPPDNGGSRANGSPCGSDIDELPGAEIALWVGSVRTGRSILCVGYQKIVGGYPPEAVSFEWAPSDNGRAIGLFSVADFDLRIVMRPESTIAPKMEYAKPTNQTKWPRNIWRASVTQEPFARYLKQKLRDALYPQIVRGVAG